jgi:hypothetical protein
VAVCKTAGSGPLHVRAGLTTITGSEPTGREHVCSRPSERRKPQVKNGFCKPIRKPDVAGQAETGEMQKARHDFAPEVGQGQRGDQRLPETAETYVGRLITQRSEVQILPPLPGKTALRNSSGGPFLLPV